VKPSSGSTARWMRCRNAAKAGKDNQKHTAWLTATQNYYENSELCGILRIAFGGSASLGRA
ncbi:MAG TPA: hypothetical protein VIS04_04405, partial [Woeseiaceae bacterium]